MEPGGLLPNPEMPVRTLAATSKARGRSPRPQKLFQVTAQRREKSKTLRPFTEAAKGTIHGQPRCPCNANHIIKPC